MRGGVENASCVRHVYQIVRQAKNYHFSYIEIIFLNILVKTRPF